MIVRSTRSFFLFLLVISFIYVTSLLLNDEADLPQWARSVRYGNWSWELLTYDLESLKQDLHSALERRPERKTEWPPQSARAGNITKSATPTSSAERKPTLPPILSGPSPYAYVFPITSDELSCAALVNIDRLINEFYTRHRIIVLVHGNITSEYLDALRHRNVTLREEHQLHSQDAGNSVHTGLLKLRAFWLHHLDPSLKRVLVVDPDTLILRSLDSLFDLPMVDLAAPRAYWINSNDAPISSTTMLITLSDRTRERVEGYIEHADPKASSDTIINPLFAKVALALPGSYDTQTSHWDKWSMPNWFRPEEVTEMEEAGRFTGSHGLVKQSTPAKIAALGWAIARWKSDFWDAEEGDPLQDRTSYSHMPRTQASPKSDDRQVALPDDHSKSAVRNALKRRSDESNGERSKQELLAAQQAAILKAKIQGAVDRTDSLAQGTKQLNDNPTVPDEHPGSAPKVNKDLSVPTSAQNAPGSTDSAIPAGQVSEPEQGPSATKISDPSPDSVQPVANNLHDEAIEHSSEASTSIFSDKTSSEEQATSTQYFSDMPIPTMESPTTTNSEPEPTPTVIDKAALERPLYNLHRVAHVLHFRDGEKPWQRTVDEFKVGHEGAHQLWAEHYKQWRQMAKRVCPAINRTHVDEKGQHWKEERLIEKV